MTSRNLKLPDSASVALPGPDGRLIAPSAARNADAIVQVVRHFAPANGRALEIASGTGEHIVRFASEFPQIIWQPSDADPVRIASIQAWIDQAPCENLEKPILLDASLAGWSAQKEPVDLIILVNLLHLISTKQVRTVIDEAAKMLAPNGRFLIYGPFRRGQEFASESDKAFHQSLVSQDGQIGYESFDDIQSMQNDCGLSVNDAIQMPANNLVLAGIKPA